MKTIVVLGASVSGVEAAHRLLKQAAKTDPVKIVLISPNTHLYWNIATTRAIIPGQISTEDLFQEIAPGFKQYAPGQFEFITATAKHLNLEDKTVTVSAATGQKLINYDMLILATGSSVNTGDFPFKGRGSTQETKDALLAFQERVKNAKSIVVAGAGLTGVETAGSLAYEYGTKKQVILVANGATVLPGALSSVSKTALKDLQALKVDVKLETKVVETAQLPNGGRELTLSDGVKLTTDLYIPAMGVTPNSSYVPADLKDSKGFVKVDTYLRVVGVKDVWAVGDISTLEPPKFLIAQAQAAHAVKNILLVLSGKEPLPWKGHFASNGFGVQIGKKAATGHMGSIWLPGFMVAKLRKSLFIEMMGPIVSGSAF